MEIIVIALQDLETKHPEDYGLFEDYVTSMRTTASGTVKAGSNLLKAVRLAKLAHLAK